MGTYLHEQYFLNVVYSTTLLRMKQGHRNVRHSTCGYKKMQLSFFYRLFLNKIWFVVMLNDEYQVCKEIDSQ